MIVPSLLPDGTSRVFPCLRRTLISKQVPDGLEGSRDPPSPPREEGKLVKSCRKTAESHVGLARLATALATAPGTSTWGSQALARGTGDCEELTDQTPF